MSLVASDIHLVNWAHLVHVAGGVVVGDVRVQPRREVGSGGHRRQPAIRLAPPLHDLCSRRRDTKMSIANGSF